jgi:drug/metabolite transporter (DMT)-like permease
MKKIFKLATGITLLFVAFALGSLFMNETLSLIQLLGAMIVLVGVYFSSKK